MKTVTFSRIDKAKFFRTLNKRVNTYFKENNIKKTVNSFFDKSYLFKLKKMMKCSHVENIKLSTSLKNFQNERED